MKVLHIHRLRGVGGSERHLLTLLPALRQRGVDARFLGFDDGEPDPFYAQLDQLDVPYDRLRAPRDLDPSLLFRTSRLTRRYRPDIVHTHLVHADVYGAAAALASGATLVSTKHNDDPFRIGPFRHVERLLAHRAARTICITGSLARFNVEQVGLPASKVVVVHYGLGELPAAWGPPGGPELPDDAQVLLAVARLEPQKGIDTAIEALARIRPRNPRAVLVVLGRGRLEQDLLDLAVDRGVADAVYLPGSVGDVTDWLVRAEMLVHPARWEGFGLALLEAMLAELPIVASGVSSIPEIVVEGETGLLVPPDDPERLASAIDALLADPDRRAAYGRAGLARVRERFSVTRMAEETEKVYVDALAGARGGSSGWRHLGESRDRIGPRVSRVSGRDPLP
jgi:glycosyltransferase involved in cell wall biosynthesis